MWQGVTSARMVVVAKLFGENRRAGDVAARCNPLEGGLMRIPLRLQRAWWVSLLAAAGAAVATSPASAAQQLQTVTCNGHQLTVRVNTNHSSQNGGWGSAKIVSGGSGIGSPVAINGRLVDTTLNQTLFAFSSAKGHGKAEHNQQTITCTEQQTGTVGDFVPPDAQLPPGASLSDDATFLLSVTVVPKGHTTIGG
jgi:hypothetical protein